jgi:hypothetical protein
MRSLLMLLGSGISVSAGMPKVDKITQRVLDDRDAVLWPDGRYGFSTDADVGWYQARARPAVQLVQYVRDFLAAADQRELTYEDLAYVVNQVAAHLRVEYENPALMPLIEQMDSELPSPDSGLKDRAQQAKRYIHDAAEGMLNRPLSSVAYLAPLVDACQEIGNVTVATLNHDRVFDSALAEAGLPFEDGFGDRQGDAVFFDDSFTDRIRVLKLHGSIDWFSFTHPDSVRGNVAARVLTGDPERAYDGSGSHLALANHGCTAFLTGGFDKILSYQSTPYTELHVRFSEALRSNDRMLVAGYGFRDKAINSQLINWMCRRVGRRIVIVDPNQKRLLVSARGAASRWIPHWLEQARGSLIEAKIDDTTWAEIRTALAQ